MKEVLHAAKSQAVFLQAAFDVSTKSFSRCLDVAQLQTFDRLTAPAHFLSGPVPLARARLTKSLLGEVHPACALETKLWNSVPSRLSVQLHALFDCAALARFQARYEPRVPIERTLRAWVFRVLGGLLLRQGTPVQAGAPLLFDFEVGARQAPPPQVGSRGHLGIVLMRYEPADPRLWPR